MVRGIVGGLALAVAAMLGVAGQAHAEQRIALVIGNANYAKGPLKTPLVDGGLIAETLNSAGFEIVEGADVNQGDLRRIFRDFLAKVEAAGPDTIAFVYFSGYGLSFEGENFLVPADVKLERESDIPLDAVRVSDLMRPLAAMPARAKAIVIDAARPHPFTFPNATLAVGLTAVEPPPGMLISYSSAPGTLAEDGQDAYGPFAVAISEMMREPGLDLDAAFSRIRVRTHQLTQGRQTPWHMSALGAPVIVVPAAPAASAAPAAPAPVVHARRPVRPMRDIGMEEAYALAIEQDSLPAYAEFVQVYQNSPYAPRVWAIIRARREALAWMRALEFNTPESYWTYLRRYPNGVYAEDAHRRLRRLAALLEPPPSFSPVEFVGVPEPLVGEPVDYVAFYPPAPPPPALLIEPIPAFYLSLPPPPSPRPGFLVVPVTMPVVAPHIRRPPRPFADPHAVRPAMLTPTPRLSPLPSPSGVPIRRGLAPSAAPGAGSPHPKATAPAALAPVPGRPARPTATQQSPKVMSKQQALGSPAGVSGRAGAPAGRPASGPSQPKPQTLSHQRQIAPRTSPNQIQPRPSPASSAAIRQTPSPTATRNAAPVRQPMAARPQTPMVARPAPTAPVRAAAPAAAPRSAPPASRCAMVNDKQVCR